MSVLSWIALIFATLAAYSAASVGTAGRKTEIKPEILDLALVAAIWVATIFAKNSLMINRWLLVAIGMVAGAFVGSLAAWARRRRPKTFASYESKEFGSARIGIVSSWKSFSHSMGVFQSRTLLSFFFFIIVFPFAVIMKLLYDPLRIKLRGRESFWIQRKTEDTPDHFWRQY